MGVNVDLPASMTPAGLKKLTGKDEHPALAPLLPKVVAVARAHTQLDVKAFDIGTAAALAKAGKASAVAEQQAQMQQAMKGAQTAAEAARAVQVEALRAEKALAKDKAAAKPTIKAVQALALEAAAYASALDKQTQAAVAELDDLLDQAQAQAKKTEAAATAPVAPDATQVKALKLLKARTIAALRQVKANNPQAPIPAFIAAIGPKTTTVMLNKAVGGTEKNLLTKLMPGEKGIKYFRGTVLWEARTFTFVSANPPGGAAKKLQAALLGLLKLKLKVRVRKPTGEVEEAGGDAHADQLDAIEVEDASAEESDFAAPDTADEEEAAAAPAPSSAAVARAALNGQLVKLLGALAQALTGVAQAEVRAKPLEALKRIEAGRKKAQVSAGADAAVAELTRLMAAARQLADVVKVLPRAGRGAAKPQAGNAAGLQAGSGEDGFEQEADAVADQVMRAGVGGEAAAEVPQPAPADPVAAVPPGPQVDPAALAQPADAMAAGPAADPQQAAYNTERAAVQTLLTALLGHKQATHVVGETGNATAALTAAAGHAAAPDWPSAMAELQKARQACVDGKGFADSYAAYLVKSVEAKRVLTAALASGWTFNNLAAVNAVLPAADIKAAAPTRNYAAASADADGLITGLLPAFKKAYLDDVVPKVAALKALPGVKFVASEVAQVDKLMAEQATLVAARNVRKLALNASQVNRLIELATKTANRRADFDAQRPKATIAMQAVRAHGKVTALPLAALEKRLKAADDLATKKTMQFEDGRDQVLALIVECNALDGKARAAKAYTQERAALGAELGALRKQPAAAKIQAELDAVRALLDDAAKAAGDAGAPGTVLALSADLGIHDFAAANVKLALARPDLATAKGLAAGLDGVAAMEDALKGKVNLTALRKGLAALQAEYDAALKDPHVDLATAEFAAVKAALDESRKQIDAKQLDLSAAALTAGGLQLTTARRLQVEHGAFVDQQAGLQSRLDALRAVAEAAAIKLAIDPLDKALTDAAKDATAKDHAKAMTGLNSAALAAGAADAALISRRAYDSHATAITASLADAKLAAIKVAQTAEAAKALALADKLDFAAAEKLLAAIDNQIAAAEAQAMATAAPPDAKLLDKATQLMAKGGGAELDTLIANLPNGTDKSVFEKLAKARFGVTFDAEADTFEQASMKQMCKLMKDIPADVTGNPSLKKITRRVTAAGGGVQSFPFYASDKDEVVMNSRPGQWKKPDFQAGAAGRLPARDPDCVPVDDPANPKHAANDLFDFNMLHELAHSIDDAKNYMGQNGSKASHGGWMVYSGNLDPVVQDAVKATKFGKTPQERQYMLDCIMRNPAVAPPEDKSDANWNAKKLAFDTWVAAATTANVWDQQAVSDQAKLGDRVYHEAYPTMWVSYDAAARKQGITSYQFRAPGEWFSELYAGWKMERLKPTHPAVAWLQTVKI